MISLYGILAKVAARNDARETIKMKKNRFFQQIVFTVLLGLASTLVQGAGQTQPVQAEERRALFPSTKMINQGRDVAAAACASCHGIDGVSVIKGTPHLAGQRAVYLYRTQQAYNEGKRFDETNKHKGFLKDEAVLSVAAYYASLTPTQITVPMVEPDADMSEEDAFVGIREAMTRCIKCHGDTGNSDSSGMPSLTAQHPDYFVSSMMGYLDGSRSHNLMKRLAGKLDEVTLRDMGVFYAVQKPMRTETQGQGDANVGHRLSQPCASCHGVDGNAHKADMPTLAGQDSKYFIKAMKHYKDGKRLHQKMFEAVENLSEQDMIDLATFYATQEPVQRNVRPPLKSSEWIARCERCHGIEGNSSDPRFPMLAGQDKDYLVKSLRLSASGENGHTTMLKMADRLSALDIERIATYFASQPPRAVVYISLPCEDE
jgi:cytochrome c553